MFQLFDTLQKIILVEVSKIGLSFQFNFCRCFPIDMKVFYHCTKFLFMHFQKEKKSKDVFFKLLQQRNDEMDLAETLEKDR